MLIKEDGYKVNFIDVNDVFVGYDTSTDCCEDADWCITDFIIDSYSVLSKYLESPASNFKPDVDDFEFNPQFGEMHNDGMDGGGIAVFMLVGPGNKTLFLHLYNIHNGYYGHGFESNTILGDDCL